MPDLSMKVYLGRIVCDHPQHVSFGGGPNDYEDDWETRREFLADARRVGWVFRRNGETICPDCSKKP